ncbi:MAG: trypsin-like serine protease [Deltaproteobacteria bacterium]|nr:trypsin-like serine protease [Deltaproteobacteria bacterium]
MKILQRTSCALAFSTVAACSPGGPLGDEEVAAVAESKIVGGADTTIEAYPWQVSLRTTSSSHFCGGSIIAPDWVLTAAHCMQGETASSLRVVAGVTRRSSTASGQTRQVSEIVIYPGFVTPTSGHDAALLHLSQPFDLSSPAVSTIPIATPADAAAGLIDAGVNAIVTGWGTLRSSDFSLPDVLQAVTVPIVSNAAAAQAYGSGQVTSDQLAAGVLGTGGKDSCQGDSGGPLTVPASGGGRILAGIVSWGNGCGQASYPGMYGRVSSFSTWIQGYVTSNQAPTVAFSTPAEGAVVSGRATFSARAGDTDGSVASVRFTFPDGTIVNDSNAPFSAAWDTTKVADGQVVVRAQAFDDLGAASLVAERTVTISNGIQVCGFGPFESSDTPLRIPDYQQGAPISSSINVQDGGAVAGVHLSLSITHTYIGDLHVTLYSPRGTAFSVWDGDGGSADDLDLTDVAISAFNGEAARGAWTLKVEDLASQDIGSLVSWSMSIDSGCDDGGSGGEDGAWRTSSHPNLPTRDNGTVCDSLTVSGSGRASDVRLDLSGTHDWRSILRGTLAHNGIVVEAFPLLTFSRGAGAFGFADRAISGFSGAAAGVWTLCIVDTDAYSDTGVLNAWAVHN